MKYLLSIPEASTRKFKDINPDKDTDWFTTSDPKTGRVGSGGGTAWLLSEAWKENKSTFSNWLEEDKKILIHGGGQSRRLPSYAAIGKLMLPVPVFRWARGQRLNQTLMDLQLPLLEELLEKAPRTSHTLIASGDALILNDGKIPSLPEADVIVIGLSVEPSVASRHGVFICPRENPENLEYMLQKPSIEKIRQLSINYHSFIDVGIWILSDKAVQILMKRSGWISNKNQYKNSVPDFYDLYSRFGPSLGNNPEMIDSEIKELKAAVINLPGAQFLHFGTSREIIESSLFCQNKVTDEKEIWTKNIKPHPSIFVQNSEVNITLTQNNSNLWIENSYIGKKWTLGKNQLITGVPVNDWKITLPDGICLDMIPVDNKWAVRLYGLNDQFRGSLEADQTLWLGVPFSQWLDDHKLTWEKSGLKGNADIQECPLFPLVTLDEVPNLIKWILDADTAIPEELWVNSCRMSANELSEKADLMKLEKQRKSYRAENWKKIRDNRIRSVYCQVDLDQGARELAPALKEVPEEIESEENILTQCHDEMFRSRIAHYKNLDESHYTKKAFSRLMNGILKSSTQNSINPRVNVFDDQIVWGRSPVRIDLAGGWSDTTPFSIVEGGKVVNVALELNGQSPIQAFIKPRDSYDIRLNSIDLGKSELIRTFEDLEAYTQIGSSFSIPKAALALCGFLPRFSGEKYKTLEEQLKQIGSGLEISFLAAVPKGSGMGTSSILAATILGTLSNFCELNWDKHDIAAQTLILEQLLTTGGGWQDQYGGILSGLKLLETQSGWNQKANVRWLPEQIFTLPEYKASMLLYYTGITRVAKNLLADIVEGMFLNEKNTISTLHKIKQHALDTWETIQQVNYPNFAEHIGRSWRLNKRLDAGTTNPTIERIISEIDDLSLGYKLPGAGGGGFLFICAKDPEAAMQIRTRLNNKPPNSRARFVEMQLSQNGLEVTRS